VIEDNLTTIGFKGQSEVYRNEAQRALKVLAKRGLKFDLIFLDPPYRMKQADEILLQMQQMEMLQDQAVVLVEHEAGHRYADEIGQFHVQKRANYGETAITIYHYLDNPRIGGGLDATEPT
jgi:16S rRNA (guanine(966)-N(2))-methyltransferase RsmD